MPRLYTGENAAEYLAISKETFSSLAIRLEIEPAYQCENLYDQEQIDEVDNYLYNKIF